MKRTLLFLVFLCVLTVFKSYSNNIQISNVSLTGQDKANHYTYIQFTVKWDNAWRDNINWDAAWIFAKFDDGSGLWKHCLLDTLDVNHTAASGSTIKIGTTPVSGIKQGMGAFIYSSSDTTAGTITWTNVKLRWNYGAQGVSDNAATLLKVFGVEMVYIPQGSFYAGDGASAARLQMCTGTSPNTYSPLYITSEDTLKFGNNIVGRAHYLTGGNLGESANGTAFNVLPPFPKGYNAVYCMKYEISQKQYADFLNCLTPVQEALRYYAPPVANVTNGYFRYTIGGVQGNRIANAPDRACNFISWSDLAAYLDWSGLRPMTELEFEKICRGPNPYLANEYAWGSVTVGAIKGFVGVDSSGTEAKSPATGTVNACYGSNLGSNGSQEVIAPFTAGPVRCGIFAASNNGGYYTRLNAGATYYGVMEMSGNVWERVVTLGNATGTSYTGLHGDGSINANGNSDISLWPGFNSGEIKSALGSGFKGGDYYRGSSIMSVSDRTYAAVYTDYSGNDNTRRNYKYDTWNGIYIYDYGFGGRGVRTAE